MKRQKIVLERSGDASFFFFFFFFCFLSLPFWREIGLGIQSALESQSCMWSSSALVSVSCVHEWKEHKQTKKKRSNRERHSTKWQRSVNIMLCRFLKKPRRSWLHAPLNYSFREMETKLNLQNFFTRPCLLCHLAQAFQSPLHLYAVGWTQAERRGIDPVVYPFLLSPLPSKGSFPLW